MSDQDDTLRAIGISPRERLERIELLLERVDSKLDGKADAAALAALEMRVRANEQMLSPAATEMRAKIAHLDAAIDKHGRKLAYATGTLSAIIVIANLLVPYLNLHV